MGEEVAIGEERGGIFMERWFGCCNGVEVGRAKAQGKDADGGEAAGGERTPMKME